MRDLIGVVHDSHDWALAEHALVVQLESQCLGGVLC